MKHNVFINKSLLGNNLAELFDFYKDSTLEHNSTYKEYEKEANNFLGPKNGEFEKQFLIDLKAKNDYVFTLDKGAYFINGKIKNKDSFLTSAMLGFSNFCVVVKNVIESVAEPEPLKMERQASPPTKAYGDIGGPVSPVGGRIN
jgi:hypothetical protein